MKHANSVTEAYLRELVRLMLETEQPVFAGILKMLPSNAGELAEIQQKIVEAHPDLVPLPINKLHITLLHQSLAKPLKKSILPTFEGTISFGDAYVIERGDRKSAFVVVNEQDALREYIKGLNIEPEAQRVYHISVANKTGTTDASVGHSEAEPIMLGAEKLKL